MAAVDVATLEVRVKTTGAQQAQSEIESLGRTGMTVANTLVRAGQMFAGAWITREFLKATIESQYSMAQLEAAVKSTGMAAGYTAQQLRELAEGLSRQSTYSHDAIEGAQSLLLTFNKIGHDSFPAATQAVMDLATRMGGDLRGAAVQLGKALQDPDKGLLALRRSGVSFSDAQTELIKKLYDTGRAAEGQKLILQELQYEFGGSAKAARDTLGGALAHLKNAFEDTLEASTESTSGIVKGINAIADNMERLIAMAGSVGVAVGAAFGAKKLAGAFGDATAAQAHRAATLAAAEADHVLAVAEQEVAVVSARRAAFDLELAAAAQARGVMTKAEAANFVAATEAEVAAQNALAASNVRVASTFEAVTVATNAATVSGRALAGTWALLKSSLPILVVSGLAYVLYQLWEEHKRAKQGAEDLRKSQADLEEQFAATKKEAIALAVAEQIALLQGAKMMEQQAQQQIAAWQKVADAQKGQRTTIEHGISVPTALETRATEQVRAWTQAMRDAGTQRGDAEAGLRGLARAAETTTKATRELTDAEKAAQEEAKKLAEQARELTAEQWAQADATHAVLLATLANNRETETAIQNIQFEAEVRKATAKMTVAQAAAYRDAAMALESEKRQLDNVKTGWDNVAAATEKAVKWMREYTSKPIGSVYAPGTGPGAATPTPFDWSGIKAGAQSFLLPIAQQFIQQRMGGAAGGMASGALSGAMMGSVVPGLGTAAGAIAGAVGGLVSSLLSSADRAWEARERMSKALGEFIRSMESRAAALEGDSRTALLLKQEGEIAAAREQFGDRYAEVAARLLDIQAQELAAYDAEVIAKRRAYEEDLAIRMLMAQGNDAAAADLKLQYQQRRELEEAEKAGLDTTYLVIVQEAELRAAREAAAKAAEEAAKAEEERRKAEQKARVDSANAFTADIYVRELEVKGLKDAASLRRLQIQHENELNEAIANGWDTTRLATLQQEEYAAAMQAIADATAAANAEAQARQDDLMADLSVRRLEAEGRKDEAALLRLQIEQARELKDAQDAGLNTTELVVVQAAELAQAYREQADAAEAAAKATQEAARAFRENLDVRELEAKGLTDNARLLRQQYEAEEEYRRAVEAGRSAEELARLKQVQGLERGVLEKQIADAAAEAAAAVVAEQAKKEGKLTAEQRETVKSVNALSETTALRVSDQITTSNALLAEIAFNTRPLRGDGIATFPGRATTAGGVTVIVQGSVIGTTPEALASWLSGAMDERQGTTNAATTQRRLGVAVA